MTMTQRARERLAILQDSSDAAEAVAANSRMRVKALRESIGLNPLGEVDPRREELAVLESRQREALGKAADVGAVLSRIRGYLDAHADHEFADVKTSDPKLKRGETHSDVVDSIRHQIANLVMQRRATQQAPVTREHQELAVRAAVVALSSRAQVSVVGESAEVRFSLRPEVAQPIGKPLIPDWIIGLSWLDPERLAERLIANLPAERKGALNPVERDQKLRDLAEQIDALELLEEAHLQQCDVPRRPDASPAAVLGIRPVGKARRETPSRPKPDDERAAVRRANEMIMQAQSAA
jgi:hypothetical protein